MKCATASGHLIDISKITPDDIRLDDIAHHLAKIQRFGGATPLNKSYVVGEHCINLVNIMPGGEDKKMALLHDAAEAYMMDLPSSVKLHLPDYKILENHVQHMIYKKYLGSVPNEDLKYKFDRQMVLDEVQHIMPDKYRIYADEMGKEAIGCFIHHSNHPSTVKYIYLKLCKLLGIWEN